LKIEEKTLAKKFLKEMEIYVNFMHRKLHAVPLKTVNARVQSVIIMTLNINFYFHATASKVESAQECKRKMSESSIKCSITVRPCTHVMFEN
jgi:hypothetical protein